MYVCQNLDVHWT